MHYNPLAYVHTEKDILKLVNVLITNTKGEGNASDPFWTKAETLLYKTNNLYAGLEKQAALNKEVKAIVRPVQTNLRTKKTKGAGKAAQD